MSQFVPSAQEIFDKFELLKVLVVGDVMLDEYFYGAVTRISPEAPVPIVQHEQTHFRLGGAANVALNIKALGGIPLLLTVVGQDDTGQKIKNLLTEMQISTEFVATSHDVLRPTTLKTRILAGSQQLLRIDKEVSDDITGKDLSQLLNNFEYILNKEKIDVVLFQDYNKGVLTEFVIKILLTATQAKKIPTAADPKLKNFFSYKNVTLFKPNLKEVRDGLNLPVLPEHDSLRAAAQKIRQVLSNTYSLITLSEQGLYFDDTNKGTVFPTYPRKIADVCGAGDTVIGTVAMCLGAGLDVEVMVRLANLAGGQVCEKVGVVPVDRVQLAAEYEKMVKK